MCRPVSVFACWVFELCLSCTLYLFVRGDWEGVTVGNMRAVARSFGFGTLWLHDTTVGVLHETPSPL